MKETIRAAKNFAKILKGRSRSIVLFYADMGAGKTTFVRHVLNELDPKIQSSSPTFSIINQYAENIYHVDLYRVEDMRELENTDFFEIIAGENIVFIEWAEKLGDLAEKLSDAVRIKIDIKEDGKRVYDITY